ncbi:hypothetical protein [Actinoplanes sp. N902-109]|uniref:hypothetical protein n=1 Tax=Actinoplanes sp. (strain N902-109) TaxID=649831 RepID=UPI00032960F0|nr:hypothetical protein [Actinoplanes sp. N902-109]AGL15045.1 hypothetical protein L083_1535 [Actinoplanes sp. N902-109]
MGVFARAARARLASRVIKRLRRAGMTDARYHSASFTVRFTRPGDDEPSVVRLTGVRRKQVTQFIAGLLRAPGLPATWAEARPLLRPVLRGVTTTADVAEPLCRPAFPFLAEFVVVDQPDTMTYVNAAHGWGVTDDEVFAAARGNLAGATLLGVATEPVVVQFVDDGDSYWTSHLLLDGWLAGLAEQVGGRPVAFAPDRGLLIVTADGSEHLSDLFTRAEAIFLSSSRAITPMAYVSDEHGATVPYEAQEDRYRLCVRRSAAVLAAREYARQAQHLPLAAELLITPEGRTRALWPTDEPALLPEAEEVQMGDTTCAWAEVVEQVKPQGLSPERWRGESWPQRR